MEKHEYNCRAVRTATYTEYWVYEKPVIGVSGREGRDDEGDETERRVTGRTIYEAEKRRQRTAREDRWRICRLIDSNLTGRDSFLTLTFAENVTDVAWANRQFKNFIKRLNYHVNGTKSSSLRYLAVWERQKRGAVHYHVCLFGIRYVPAYVIEDVWGHGNIDIRAISDTADGSPLNHVSNIGLYVSKYFTKADAGERCKHRYFTSRNLVKPLERRFVLDGELDLGGAEVLFEKEYKRQTPRVGSDGSVEWEESRVRYVKVFEPTFEWEAGSRQVEGSV